MNKSPAIFLAILATLAIAAPVQAKKKKTATSEPTTQATTAPESDAAREAISDQTLNKQAAAIVEALNLNVSAKAARVQDVIVTDLKAVRDWHNTHHAPSDIELKLADDATPGPTGPAARQAAEDMLIPKSITEQFNTGLAADLSPDQVEIVKDKLTINKVQVTYDAYLEIITNLTDKEKTQILSDLKQAREDCMDVKNMEGKSAIFKLYKNKIKAYLKADGHDVDKDYKDWGAAQKAKTAAKTTEPSQ